MESQDRTLRERSLGERTDSAKTCQNTGNLVEKWLPSSMRADVEEADICILHLTALHLLLLDLGGLLLLLILDLLVAGPLARVVTLQVHGDRSRS